MRFTRLQYQNDNSSGTLQNGTSHVNDTFWYFIWYEHVQQYLHYNNAMMIDTLGLLEYHIFIETSILHTISLNYGFTVV